jgi:predicted DsbA family dithiol-disulfide isomerase
MKIQIWSDIMCPFCYIGKRHFENSLAMFQHREQVEIEWKSFQLDPSIPAKPATTNVFAYLAESKGITVEESKKMHQRVAEMAQQAGLAFNFDTTVVANSFEAHRLIQLSKKFGLENEIEEALFQAYFTDGKNLNDPEELQKIGSSIGLSDMELNKLLTSDDYSAEVREDLQLAGEIGVRGVPFFIIDSKYAVSGAQPVDVFLSTLEKAHELGLTADSKIS